MHAVMRALQFFPIVAGSLMGALLVMSTSITSAAEFSFNPLTELHWTNNDRRHLLEECADTSEWFATRGSDGVNLFRTFFDCTCEGDLNKYYTYHCRLDDYCFIDMIDNTTERCVNFNVTFDFSVNETTGMINQVERGNTCTDYLNNTGPKGRICNTESSVCILKLRRDYTFSTEYSQSICRNKILCPTTLADLGYTEEQIQDLCPSVTMDGTECAQFSKGECNDTTDSIAYIETNDCSNVEACAVSSCQQMLRVFPTPGRLIRRYPECESLYQSTTIPPTTIAPLSMAPNRNPPTELPMQVPTNSPSELLTDQKCVDTSEWFSTRASGGVNLFRSFFDCTCEGDLNKYYIYHCRLDDYCFTDLIDNTTERCVNFNVTYDFSVNESTGSINEVERGNICTDYLKNTGPKGRICSVDPTVCLLKLKDDHSYSTEDSVSICTNRTLCPTTLADLGYTEKRIEELCPSVTMDGTECAQFSPGQCKDTTDKSYYVRSHDCSNIEECAVSSCQEMLKVSPTPGRNVRRYPACESLYQSTTMPPKSVAPLPIAPTFPPNDLPVEVPTNPPSALLTDQKCADTSEWFSTRASGGVNLFRTFFDCTCEGDLSSYYTYHCRLDEYCFTDLIDNTTERCVNFNVTYDFSVDETTGMINTIERGSTCTDYLNNTGPKGRICSVNPNVCALKMKDEHSFSTEASASTCQSTVLCPTVLAKLGYTEKRIEELCPSVTMDGTECTQFSPGQCNDITDKSYYVRTHDCSNVEACAVSSCQEMLRVFPTPGRSIWRYPACESLYQSTTMAPIDPPTNPPTDVPTHAPTAVPTDPDSESNVFNNAGPTDAPTDSPLASGAIITKIFSAVALPIIVVVLLSINV